MINGIWLLIIQTVNLNMTLRLENIFSLSSYFNPNEFYNYQDEL